MVPPGQAAGRGQDALKRALEFVSQGRPGEAARRLTNFTGNGADRAAARLYRSVARRMMGDAAGADADLAMARRLKPYDAAVLWATAARYREKGLTRKALAECETAERLGGATAEWLAMRADIETSLGLPLESASTSRRAAGLAPRNAELRLRAARRLKGVAFFRGALIEARAARLAGDLKAAPRLESELQGFLKASSDAPRVEPQAGVDPRLELLAVVGALAARPGLETGFEFRADSSYGSQASRWFHCYRGHEAVKLYRDSMRQGLTAVGAQRSMLSLGPPPGLKNMGHEEYRRSMLLDALRDFAERARFGEFFTSQRSFYRSLRRGVAAQAAKCRFGALFAEYTGKSPPVRYDVLLCPLYRRGRHDTLNCLIAPGTEARYRIVSTLGPTIGAEGGLWFDYRHMRWSIWHEMAHALSDHWLEGHQASLGRSRCALTAASARRYGWWGQVVREHIVQGLATRMEAWAVKHGKVEGPCGDAAGDNPLPYLPRIVSCLSAYESRRDLYPTLADFYPRLIALFEALARRKPPSSGVLEGRSQRSQSDGLN